MKSAVIVGFLFSCFISVSTLFGASAEELIKEGDAFHDQQNPDSAWAKFKAAEQLDPENADILWRISREYYDKANVSPEDQQEPLYLLSEKYARKAANVSPDNAKAHLWIAISVGKVALLKGGKEKVELSKEVKDEAMRSIALDSTDDTPYHVLARWHYEVANLSWVLKTAAKIVYGGLPAASNKESIKYFKKAIEIAPNHINHHLQLAKVYIATDQDNLARQELKKAIALPVSDAEDPANKAEAKKLLAKLGE